LGNITNIFKNEEKEARKTHSVVPEAHDSDANIHVISQRTILQCTMAANNPAQQHVPI